MPVAFFAFTPVTVQKAVAQEAEIIQSVLGAIGIGGKKVEDDIDYRARPSLVLPPKIALPPPQAPGANRTAAWPQDPDVVKRRKDLEAARVPSTGRNNENDRLSKEELLQGRVAAKPAQSNQPVNPHCGDNTPSCLYVPWDQLAAKKVDDTKELVAGKEPDRALLTEPPKGYRLPTKAVKATSEAPVRDDSADPKAFFRKKQSDDE